MQKLVAFLLNWPQKRLVKCVFYSERVSLRSKFVDQAWFAESTLRPYQVRCPALLVVAMLGPVHASVEPKSTSVLEGNKLTILYIIITTICMLLLLLF